VQRLQAIENVLLEVAFVACGGDVTAQLDHRVQLIFECVVQVGALQHLRRKVGFIQVVECAHALAEFDAQVGVGPLRIDAGEDQRQYRAGHDISAAQHRGVHVIGGRTTDHGQGRANQQRHVGVFAQGQVAAREHHHRAPQQHRGE